MFRVHLGRIRLGGGRFVSHLRFQEPPSDGVPPGNPALPRSKEENCPRGKTRSEAVDRTYLRKGGEDAHTGSHIE